MQNNIETEYQNGQPKLYVTKSTPELKIPSLGFKTKEEAEFAVAVAKLLKAYNIDYFTGSEFCRDIQSTFRALGLVESEWFGLPDKNDKQD